MLLHCYCEPEGLGNPTVSSRGWAEAASEAWREATRQSQQIKEIASFHSLEWMELGKPGFAKTRYPIEFLLQNRKILFEPMEIEKHANKSLNIETF